MELLEGSKDRLGRLSFTMMALKLYLFNNCHFEVDISIIETKIKIEFTDIIFISPVYSLYLCNFAYSDILHSRYVCCYIFRSTLR